MPTDKVHVHTEPTTVPPAHHKPASPFIVGSYSKPPAPSSKGKSKEGRRSRTASEHRSRRNSHHSDVVSTKILRSVPLRSAVRPLRHMLHVLLLVAGWMLGTVVFYAIEVPAEHQQVADTYVQLNDAIDLITVDMMTTAKSDNKTDVRAHVKKAYIKLLEIEGKWRWSAIQKTEGPEPHYMWTFGTSFFFVFTLFTTVGYGSIYPWTDAGRAFVIVFSCFFYPFSLVVIRDLGQLTLTGMTIVYGKLLIKVRTLRGILTSETETITLPWKITVTVSMLFIALCGVFFKYYDDFIGPEEGFNHFIAFYFSFLSLTMIGLGDIMPTNEPWAPINAIIITAGLPLMRVITKMTYLRMENAYFGFIVFLESKIGVKEEKVELETRKVEHVEKAVDSEDEDEETREQRLREELLNNMSVQSLGKYIASGRDVYGGDFGRVNLKKSDL